MTGIKGIIVKTSKSNLLWPTEYWKTMFDSIFRHGSKNNPFEKYPDLQRCFCNKIHHDSRYYLKLDNHLQNRDDSELRLINIVRVDPGNETISLTNLNEINTSDWYNINFPYFGTIGNSTYESQTKKNRQKIENSFYKKLVDNSKSESLSLSFQLSETRRDRDLDNLTDALMPLFNKYNKNLENLLLIKEDSTKADDETLRFSH